MIEEASNLLWTFIFYDYLLVLPLKVQANGFEFCKQVEFSLKNVSRSGSNLGIFYPLCTSKHEIFSTSNKLSTLQTDFPFKCLKRHCKLPDCLMLFRLTSIKYLVCNVCLRFVKNSQWIQSEPIVVNFRRRMWTNLWFVCTMPDIDANVFAAEASGNPCSRAFCCNEGDNEVYPRLALRSLFTGAKKANCLIPKFKVKYSMRCLANAR